MDNLRLILMNILPKKSLSRLVGNFARSTYSRFLIPTFAKQYQINLDEAEKTIDKYSSLTDFFIRRLKPGSRAIADGDEVIVSPVDGKVSVFGTIENGTLIQAKGVYFTVNELLGGDEDRASRYNGGQFMTIYLSPQDYHRIHTPLAGEITGYAYVPGTLFPVNAFGVRAVKGLFARNERVITYLNTEAGEVAVIKVGAIIVGSVKVNYSDITTNVRGGQVVKESLKGKKGIQKGDEVGRFEFGSTVILLFERDKVSFRKDLSEGEAVKMGSPLGQVNK
jgi:phosphatidylserine decarboxylase